MPAATPVIGLSSDEAARRLIADGPNELPGGGPRSLGAITRHVLGEPMFLLLLAASGIYITLGDVREALVLSASIGVILAITIVQERRTENALAKLRDLSSPRALVVRDGTEQRVAGRDVVVGDVILLREGDRVPADGILSSAVALSIDESILTGESLPVDKQPQTAEPAPPAPLDPRSEVSSSTLVVRGFGTARITATGARTRIGQIGRALESVTSGVSPLYREVRRIVRLVAIAALLLCILVAVFYGASNGDWLGGALVGITLAMGVLPEEFPVVLTVFLAMGAWRISKSRVLTRRMPAIETIGAATVLAVDKTGTLTENRMRVAVVEGLASKADLRGAVGTFEPELGRVLATALAASEQAAFDPMERAIHEAASLHVASALSRPEGMQLAHEYDLTPELMAVTHVWRTIGHAGCEIAVKGAPETVLTLCQVGSESRSELLGRVAGHARDGLRVLAVAAGRHDGETMPESPRDFELEFLGLVCFADPLRAEVPAALAECTQAGIRVVMITGDHPGTALAIAGQAGFAVSAGALTGAEMAGLDDDELRERSRHVNIYARTTPDQKLRLVQALRANGEVVVMTGDGVNDAPALKAAHVGVAMGSRGTDVAREAASLVLLNDDFAALVSAVRLGRRIYDNIRNAMSYLVAVHIPIAGMGLLPVLLGWPLVLFPVHVLFMEFLIDPACSFIFEADEAAAGIMRSKPRPPDAPLFSRAMLGRSIALGTAALGFSFGVYGVALQRLSDEEARALGFMAMILSNWLTILVSRSRGESLGTILARPNVIFWAITLGALVAIGSVVSIPAVAALFRFSRPPPGAIAGVVAGGLLLLVGALALRAGRPARQPE